jgi:hypothetical protein
MVGMGVEEEGAIKGEGFRLGARAGWGFFTSKQRLRTYHGVPEPRSGIWLPARHADWAVASRGHSEPEDDGEPTGGEGQG